MGYFFFIAIAPVSCTIQSGREIIAIIVTDDYLCSTELNSPYKVYLLF